MNAFTHPILSAPEPVCRLRVTQLEKLDAMIARAIAARDAARTDNLFASTAGQALVNAMHDLTEVDGLYDLADDIAHVMASEPAAVDWMAELGRAA